MIESIFKVDIYTNEYRVEALNEEAKSFESEFIKRKRDVDATISILKFILSSPNILTIDPKGSFIYEVDMCMKEKALEELFIKRDI